MNELHRYRSVLNVLSGASNQDLSSEFIQYGVINKFFLQFNLAVQLMKALLTYEGVDSSASGSPREIIKASYRYFTFIDEEVWLRMLRDRNDTAHIYDGSKAIELVHTIIATYIPTFQQLEEAVVEHYGEDFPI